MNRMLQQRYLPVAQQIESTGTDTQESRDWCVSDDRPVKARSQIQYVYLSNFYQDCKMSEKIGYN